MSGEVQNFLETINPFYEFVSHRENERAKESDQWTGSSTSETETSSASTPNQNTPAQTTKTVIQNGWKFQNGNHDMINGNRHESEEDETDREDPPLSLKLNGHSTNHRLVSSFHPPAAPVHRSSISSTLPILQSQSLVNSDSPTCSDNPEKDDVLKVDVDLPRRGQEEEWMNSTLHARLSAENLHSGTESEKYYSGDSEPEADAERRSSPVLMSSVLCQPSPNSQPTNSLFSLPALSSSSTSSSSTSGINFQAEKVCQDPHLDLILQNTVDRLNRDVDHILARIRLLEAAYATNEQFSNAALAVTQRKGGRSVLGLTPPAFTLILTWPFLVFFIIKLIKLWLSRRRKLSG